MSRNTPLPAGFSPSSDVRGRDPRALIDLGDPVASSCLLDDEFDLRIGGTNAGYVCYNAELDVYDTASGPVCAVTALEFGGEARRFGLGHVTAVAHAGMTAVVTALLEDDEARALELLLVRAIARHVERRTPDLAGAASGGIDTSRI